MEAWPIYVAGWQMECCGAPFAIGDLVAWRIRLSDAWPADDFLVDVRGDVVDAFPDEVNGDGYLLHRRDLKVWLDAPRLRPGQVSYRGVLYREEHGKVPERFPLTRGTVQRIQMVSRRHAQVSPGSWEALAEPASLSELRRSPARFDDDLSSTAGVPDDVRLSQDGLLVTLEVSG